MKNASQIENLSQKKLTLTPSKTIDFILGFLGSIGIVFSPLLLGSDSVILAAFFVICALILTKAIGLKYLFYGILWLALIAGLFLGVWVFIALNMSL